MSFVSTRAKKGIILHMIEKICLFMDKRNKIFTYGQILFVICGILFNGGTTSSFLGKPGKYPCEGHQCGCRSESDCRVHCCCGLHKNQGKFLSNGNEQKSSFRAFINNVNCKYGNDPQNSITLTSKYIVQGNVQPGKESFLYFLSHYTSIPIPEMIVSPPEKPPRYFV